MEKTERNNLVAELFLAGKTAGQVQEILKEKYPEEPVPSRQRTWEIWRMHAKYRPAKKMKEKSCASCGFNKPIDELLEASVHNRKAIVFRVCRNCVELKLVIALADNENEI